MIPDVFIPPFPELTEFQSNRTHNCKKRIAPDYPDLYQENSKRIKFSNFQKVDESALPSRKIQPHQIQYYVSKEAKERRYHFFTNPQENSLDQTIVSAPVLSNKDAGKQTKISIKRPLPSKDEIIESVTKPIFFDDLMQYYKVNGYPSIREADFRSKCWKIGDAGLLRCYYDPLGLVLKPVNMSQLPPHQKSCNLEIEFLELLGNVTENPSKIYPSYNEIYSYVKNYTFDIDLYNYFKRNGFSNMLFKIFLKKCDKMVSDNLLSKEEFYNGEFMQVYYKPYQENGYKD